MDWSKGFSSRYYVSIVDPNTWSDTETLDITEGSISKSDEGTRESADLTFIDYDPSEERWIRIWLDARQEGDLAHIPLFTGLAVSPTIDFDGQYVTNQVNCYSVLKPVDDVLLQKGWYASSGIPTEDIVRELLAPTSAPIIFDDDCPNLSSDIIAESNETNLSMIETILYSVEWRIVISGDGTINIVPMANGYLEKFDPNENDVLETQVSVEHDWFSCPNVLRVKSGNQSYVYRDEDPDSRYSIENRGREIWEEESDTHLNAGETLEQYAERRLLEKQQTEYKVSYSRRFFPDIYPSDLIYLSYPNQNIDGVFYISTQDISLSHGATVSEAVEKI